ncbi:cysteine desulfurase-like protein [Streptomyces violaceusniger]
MSSPATPLSTATPMFASASASALAACFPGLRRLGADGRPFVHADAPGGTQVVDSVITAITDYLRRSNANPTRPYQTSVESAELLRSVRSRFADFAGASADGVVFGPNSTTLIRHFAHAFAATLHPGDNIVCTQLDHDANIAPWLAIAHRRGAQVRFVPLDPDTFTLDHSALSRLVDERTRLVAFTRSSNLIGTTVPPAPFVEAARSVGALTFADGVAAAAHRPLEQFAHGIDVSVSSPYKYFGPHLGVMTARPELLQRYAPEKVRPAPDSGPRRWESGMPTLELIAGLGAAVDYVTTTGYPAITARERKLTERVLAGLRDLAHVRLYGVDAPDDREPTFAVTVAGMSPQDAASRLADQGMFVSAGHNYALECAQALHLPRAEGAVRFGLVHYHSDDDVDRILQALADLRP